MTIPNYVLSFDPGGKVNTWCYCLSRVNEGLFEPVEWGFAPILEDLSNIDLTPYFQFRDGLIERYGESIDLVAERFIGRGFTSKISEYIPYSLGVWTAIWKGKFKLIMASAWKTVFKRFNKHYQKTRYDNWWEHYFEYLKSEEDRKRKVVHLQDAASIGMFYYRKVLKVECKLKDLTF